MRNALSAGDIAWWHLFHDELQQQIIPQLQVAADEAPKEKRTYRKADVQADTPIVLRTRQCPQAQDAGPAAAAAAEDDKDDEDFVPDDEADIEFSPTQEELDDEAACLAVAAVLEQRGRGTELEYLVEYCERLPDELPSWCSVRVLSKSPSAIAAIHHFDEARAALRAQTYKDTTALGSNTTGRRKKQKKLTLFLLRRGGA
jgi:hypothetical protein